MYGKIIDGVFKEAPQTYNLGGYTIANFNEDINLMTELGYKEVVPYDVPVDTRYRYISTYEERDGKIYENRELDTTPELIEDIQARLIDITKENLSIYLEGNPLVSAVKGEEKEYTVTLEKQQLLQAQINNYVSEAILRLLGGEVKDTVLTWNAQGETSEVWTFDELHKLKCEIEDYVKPIVEYQRHIEEIIRNTEAQDELYRIDLTFYKDKIDKYTNGGAE